MIDEVLLNWYRELKDSPIDFRIVHVFPFYQIAIEHDFGTFKQAINYMIKQIYNICKRGVKDITKLKWEIFKNKQCYCGSKVITPFNELISERFGGKILSPWACLGIALMNMVKDRTLVVITYPKVTIPNMVDLLPSNVNVSILVNHGKTKPKLNDVLNIIESAMYKIVFMSDTYTRELLEDIKIDTITKIIQSFEYYTIKIKV